MSIQSALMGSSAQPLTVGVTTTSAYGSRSGAGSCTTSGIQALPVGGLSPYTYLWSYVAGDTAFTATAGTSADTGWTCTLTLGGAFDATWKCKVTSADGQIAYTPNVDVSAVETSFV